MSQQEEAKLDPTAIEQGKFFWPGSSESHADCLDGHSIRQGGSNGNSGEGASSRVTLSPLMARILSMQPGGALGDGLLSTVDLVAQHSDLLAEASAPTMARYYRGLPAGSLVRPPPCRNHRIEHVRQLAGLWFDICIDPIRRVICQAHMSATLSALLYAGFSGRPIVIRAMAAGEGVTSKDGHRNLSLAQLAREAAEESLFQDILSFYQILDSSFVFDETSDFTPNSRRPNCAARARNYCTFERLPRSPAPAPPPPEKPSGIPAPLAGTDPGPSLGLAGGESMEPTGVGSSHEAGVPEDALPVLPGPMPTPGGPRDGASLLSQSLHRQALEAASLGGLGAGDPAAALPEAETQADPATCWETHARPQPLIAPLTIAPGPVVFHIHWPAPGPAASDLAGRAGGQLPISLAGQPMFLVAAESQWLAGSKHPVWKDCHVLAKKLRAFVRLFSEKTSRSYFSPPAASSSTGPYSSSTGSGHASHAFSIHPSIALEGLLSESRGKVSLFAYRYIGELHALADGDWAQMRLFVDRLAAEAKTSPYSALALETLGQFLALHIESTPEPGTWDTARRDDCPPMTAAISRDPTQYVSWIVRQWLGLDEECDTIYLRDLEAASQELLQWAQAKSVPDVESDAVASAERISDLIFGLGL
ncbi:hypothetical protein, variant [Fonticula alba]|nr:hypothetical protein, variant [Fonticula alba]KCV68212.1 hypothetical protein, variant [Fonticula alba]|eukprot:XP_009497266.1 hypothetical protein, variant [Fonticula alba]